MLALSMTGTKIQDLPWRRAGLDAFIEAVKRGG